MSDRMTGRVEGFFDNGSGRPRVRATVFHETGGSSSRTFSTRAEADQWLAHQQEACDCGDIICKRYGCRNKVGW